jgi:hypothetical protein
MRSVNRHWVVRSGSLQIIIDMEMMAIYVARNELESIGRSGQDFAALSEVQYKAKQIGAHG